MESFFKRATCIATTTALLVSVLATGVYAQTEELEQPPDDIFIGTEIETEVETEVETETETEVETEVETEIETEVGTETETEVETEIETEIETEMDSLSWEELFPDEIKWEGFSFNVKTGTITRYTGKCFDVFEIPSSINGIAVTGIDQLAF